MTVVPEIVLGPPGTGKTTALLEVVDEEFAAGAEPGRVGYVSFTRRAATEAATRAAEKFGMERRDLRWFRTLHSLCFQALGLSSGDVLEGKKMREFGDWLGVEFSEHANFGDEGSTFGFQPGDRALFMENLARVRQIPLRQQYEIDHDGLAWPFVEKVSRGLRQYKADHDLVDYTDMLDLVAAGGSWLPTLDVLIGDESQDMSPLQWAVFWRLAERARRVVLAGDDDQAIYAWAGSAVDYFVALEGRPRTLGQSHRCPAAVQRLSHEIVGRIRHRRPKEWLPRPEEGAVLRATNPWERVDWTGDDVLVLVRNAFVARERVLPWLRQSGVFYEWRGTPAVRPTVLEAVLVWERLRRGEPASGDEARRAYSMMTSGVGVRRGFKLLPAVAPEQPVTLADLKESGGLLREDIWHQALDLISAEEKTYMLRALKRGERLRSKPRVRVSTIHGSKGGEANHVVVLLDMAPRTWQEMSRRPEDEARVWYVATTRARQQLTLVTSGRREAYDI